MFRSQTLKIGVLIMLAVVFLATACTSTPTPDPTQALPTSAPAPTTYPEPVADTPSDPEYTPNATPYPLPVSTQEADWAVAETFILSGQVISIAQGKDLAVTITLQDGRVIATTQPAADEVLKVIEKCGSTCANILVTADQ